MRTRNIEFVLIGLLSLYCVYFYWDTGKHWHFIGAVILIVHEAGHEVFRPLGELIYIAGGSLAQVLLPLIAFVNFWKLRRPYTAAAMLMWLSMSLFDMAVYAGDAIDMALPLVSVGGNGEGAIHDWNYLLDHAGLLQHAAGVAAFIRLLGFLSIAAAVYIAWRARVVAPGQQLVMD